MKGPGGCETPPASMGGLWTIVVLIALTVLAAPLSGWAASDAPPAPEDLFKWGEYDSLIRVLEPTIYNGARTEFTRLDSVLHAKTFLYLGVAYYATGKREHADDAFTHACELDSAIKIDRFYVTEEIAGHFEGIAAVLASRRRQARIMGATMPSGEYPEPGPKPAPSHGSRREAKVAAGDGHGWIWWTLGSALVLAGGGAYYLLHQHKAPGENVTQVNVP